MSDNEVFCSCKECKKKRKRQVKEFTEQYGEFRTKKELVTAMLTGDTVPVEVLKERAQAVIAQKKEQERLEKEAELEATRQEEERKAREEERAKREEEDKARLLAEWQDKKEYIISENKTLTKDSLKQIELLAEQIDTKDPIALNEFGVTLQRSFNAINENVSLVFEESDVKAIKKTLAILFEKANKYDGASREEYEQIKSDFEKLQAELEPMTRKSEAIIEKYNSEYSNIEKLVKNIDIFIEAGNTCLTRLEQDKQKIAGSFELSDLQKLSQLDNANSLLTRMNRRIEGLSMTKAQAISFVTEINAMKNVERAFIDELSNIIYNVIPVWNNKAKSFFDIKEANDIKLELDIKRMDESKKTYIDTEKYKQFIK